MLSLRKFKGKRLVSYLRNGDYSHPGEAESIDLVISLINKNKNNKLLDVGCGLGGTQNLREPFFLRLLLIYSASHHEYPWCLLRTHPINLSYVKNCPGKRFGGWIPFSKGTT